MENILVLGIGNRLMMDDGMGIYVVDELLKQNDREDIQYIIGESDIDFCLEHIENASFVLIVDAIYGNKEPGEVSMYPLENILERQALDISPHNIHLFQVLYLQREKVKGYLIGIEPVEIRFHLGMSPEIQQKWPVIVQSVKRNIQNIVETDRMKRLF